MACLLPHGFVASGACYSRSMRLLIVVIFVGCTVLFAQDTGTLTEADGADFESALNALYRNISDSDNQTTGLSPSSAVVLTQRALNGYLRFQGTTILPEGLSDVTIEIQSDGRLTGTGTLDLDQIEDFDAGSVGMLQFLSGSLPVALSVTLKEVDGELHVGLGDTQIGPVRVPPALGRLLIQRYSVNERYPNGIDLDNPISIPSAVEDIQIEQGQIIVVTK